MQRIIYSLLFVFLTSCAVGPDYHRPKQKLPVNYSMTKKYYSSAKNETRFWETAIRDPILRNLVKQAVNSNNLDIQQALATLQQSRAQLRLVKADYFPTLSMSGVANRERFSANQPLLSAIPSFRNVPLSYTEYKLEFDTSWEIDVFGHTRRSVEASRAQFQSNLENLRNVSLIVAAEVARTYVQYRVYQQRILLALKLITSYSKTAELVKLQMKEGSATGVDLDRAQSELLSAKAALPPLLAEAKATLASLAVLVGKTPEELFKSLQNTTPIPEFNPKVLKIGLPSDLLMRRPDIRMAERNLALATANIGVAVANEFPRFHLVGDLGSDTVKGGTYFNKASSLWSIGPQIYIPIFEGGRLKYAVKEQEAIRNAALASYKKSVLQALADVESSLIRYDRHRETKQRFFASYRKIKASQRLIQLQYQTGQTSLLDVLDVERQLDSIYDQYIQSIGQVTIDLISLYKAVGGDWAA